MADAVSSFYSTITVNRLTKQQYYEALSSGYISSENHNFEFYLTEEDDIGQFETFDCGSVNSIINWTSYSTPPKNHWMVHFDAGEGTAQFEFKNVRDGDAIGTLPTYSLSGKTYDTWYDEDENIISSSTVINSNSTFYGHGKLELDELLKFTADEANSTVGIVKVGSPSNTLNLIYSKKGIIWKTYNVGDIITLKNVGDSVYIVASEGGNTTINNSF